MMEEDYVATQTWRVTPDLMCILDPEGRFVAVNPAWEPTLGWAQDELLGARYPKFLHPDDVDRSNRVFETVKRGQPVMRFENRYRTRSGDYRWFSWVAVPEGDLFYCTVRDVTDDKLREDTIVEQREEADLREQFLAILGHDLRNPLSAIMAGTRMLSRAEQTEKSAGLLKQMEVSARRMDELISNMMDFARVRLGDGIGLDCAVAPDFAERISQTVSEAENAFPDFQAELRIDLQEEVYCDVSRILQLLSNLLANAAVHGDLSAPVKVYVQSENKLLRLSVCNGGEQIADDTRPNLFQPFFKGTPTSSPQGLGLGLYISSQIAAAHGGELTVRSDEMETCFLLTAPCSP